ncbi:MAG: hypothetical protein ACYT04_85745, partial [Nostoc sp.]
GRLTLVNAFIADRSIRDIPLKGRTQVICDERLLALPQATRRANNRSEYDYFILSTRNLSLG